MRDFEWTLNIVTSHNSAVCIAQEVRSIEFNAVVTVLSDLTDQQSSCKLSLSFSLKKSDSGRRAVMEEFTFEDSVHFYD